MVARRSSAPLELNRSGWSREGGPGPERYVLALALFVPLAAIVLALAQIPGVTLGEPATTIYGDNLVVQRPVGSTLPPPPTLAAPTATPLPTATPVPAVVAEPTAAPSSNRSYTVQPGDELKYIAADYGVSIWTIIDANDIPNPDSLRVGQVLKIPAQ